MVSADKCGNAAKLREALEDSQSLLESFSRGDYGAQVREQMRDNRAALAKPPRNCDSFADEAEASKAFIVWYNTVFGLNGDKWNEVSSCDLKHNINDILHDYIEWLFAPTEEGSGA